MASKKILVVDDDKGIRTFVVHILEHEGYRVTTATDGEEALEKLDTENPSLILLDIMMPGINGYQACRQIKGRNEYRHVPVLFLTAKDQPSDRFWASKVGGDGFLTKPFDPTDLLELVAAMLEKSEPVT